MESNKFDQLMKERLESCEKVLSFKNQEYASDVDRLHNFVSAGRMMNVQPLTALFGMMAKHIVSFQDIVERMEKDPEYCPSTELVAEKLGDVINYTLLAEGLIEDKREDLSYFHSEKDGGSIETFNSIHAHAIGRPSGSILANELVEKIEKKTKGVIETNGL